MSVMSSINAAEFYCQAWQLQHQGSSIAHQKHGLQMLLLPRWSITHRLMKGYAVFLPLSAVYIVLLARSWTPDMLQLMMPGSLDAGLSGQPASGVLILHIRPTRPPADVCSWCDNSAAQGKTGVFAAGGFRPQFFPSLEGIATLFSRATTAASLWVHLLAINLFAARSAYLEGEQSCCNLLPCILCGC